MEQIRRPVSFSASCDSILNWKPGYLILEKIQALLSLHILEMAGQGSGLSVTHLFFLELMKPDLCCNQNMMKRLSVDCRSVLCSLKFISWDYLLLLNVPGHSKHETLLRSTWSHKNRNLTTFSWRAEGICLLFVLIWAISCNGFFEFVSQANNSRQRKFICENSVWLGAVACVFFFKQLSYSITILFSSHPHSACFHLEWQTYLTYLFNCHFRICYRTWCLGYRKRRQKLSILGKVFTQFMGLNAKCRCGAPSSKIKIFKKKNNIKPSTVSF